MNIRTSIGSCLLIAGSVFAVTAWGQDVASSQSGRTVAQAQLPTMEVYGPERMNTRFERDFTQAEQVVHRIRNSDAVKRLAPDELKLAEERLTWAEQALARETFAGWQEYPIVRRCSQAALAHARLAEAKAGQVAMLDR